MDQTIRVGVVGLGFAGNVHTMAYKKIPGVEVVALAGLEEDRLQLMGKEYSIPNLYSRWEDLVARSDLDAVSVCTPNYLHAPVAIAALESGKHVLCEKPLARNTEEAQSMVDAALRNRRVLQTAFNHRQRGDIMILKQYIDSGTLGKIYYAKGYWMRRQGIPGLGSWFTSKELSGGGPLIDLGVHVLDQLMFLLGEPEITTVSASTYAEFGPRGRGVRRSGLQKMFVGADFDVEDLATAFMRTEDGATVCLEASWAVQADYDDDFGLDLYGTEGGAQMRVKRYGWQDTLRIFTDHGDVPVTITPQTWQGTGHQAVVENFIDAIRSGNWSAHAGHEGLRRVQIVEACYKSALEGREISLQSIKQNV